MGPDIRVETCYVNSDVQLSAENYHFLAESTILFEDTLARRDKVCFKSSRSFQLQDALLIRTMFLT